MRSYRTPAEQACTSMTKTASRSRRIDIPQSPCICSVLSHLRRVG